MKQAQKVRDALANLARYFRYLRLLNIEYGERNKTLPEAQRTQGIESET